MIISDFLVATFHLHLEETMISMFNGVMVLQDSHICLLRLTKYANLFFTRLGIISCFVGISESWISTDCFGMWRYNMGERIIEKRVQYLSRRLGQCLLFFASLPNYKGKTYLWIIGVNFWNKNQLTKQLGRQDILN